MGDEADYLNEQEEVATYPPLKTFYPRSPFEWLFGVCCRVSESPDRVDIETAQKISSKNINKPQRTVRAYGKDYNSAKINFRNELRKFRNE